MMVESKNEDEKLKLYKTSIGKLHPNSSFSTAMSFGIHDPSQSKILITIADLF